MTATAVLTLREAVVAVIEGITMLAGAKVYNEGEVVLGSPLPYAVIAAWSEPEGSQRNYGQPGADQSGQIRWWGKDKDEAQRAFAAGKLVLDDVELALTGHRTTECRLGYLTDFAEPNPQVGGHVVVSRLRTRTIVA